MLTQKQEIYAQNLHKGMYQRDAYRDAYKPTYALATIDANASRLANNAKVLTRLEELRQRAEDEAVATVIERKQRLTEILRADIPDYMTEDGIKVGKESPNVGAVSEVTTKTRVYKKTSEPIVITNLKLHNPIQAIAELNKMEKIYSEAQVNVDNRSVHIHVNSDKAKELTERLLEGEGTE